MHRDSWTKLLAEGVVIATGVLAALAADAWWERQVDVKAAREQVVALSRDFEQMSARADSSLWSAQTAVGAGESLVAALLGPSPEDVADSAMSLLMTTLRYEIFSPSTGSYDALVASGNIELLGNTELKRALTDFFGSFDDLRASEGVLLSFQRDFVNSQSFHSLVGARLMRSLRAGNPAAAPQTVTRWADSDELVNGIYYQKVVQEAVLDDYMFLRDSINEIQRMLIGVGAF